MFVSSPHPFSTLPGPGWLSYRSNPLPEANSMAAPHAETVEYTHGALTLEGFVVSPTATGKQPGIMVVHEWWGHNPYVRRRAEMLAGLGYVGFAVDLFGKGVRATDTKDAG